MSDFDNVLQIQKRNVPLCIICLIKSLENDQLFKVLERVSGLPQKRIDTGQFRVRGAFPPKGMFERQCLLLSL